MWNIPDLHHKFSFDYKLDDSFCNEGYSSYTKKNFLRSSSLTTEVIWIHVKSCSVS